MSIEFETKTYSVDVDIDPLTGRVLQEAWKNDTGAFERPDDRPAFICYCPDTGKPTYQRWHNSEGTFREGDRPAVLVIDPYTNVAVAESFEVASHSHREGDKPALIFRHADGLLKEVSYWQHGKRHRDPQLGPAHIYYSEKTSEVLKTVFWVNGAQEENPSDNNKPILDI